MPLGCRLDGSLPSIAVLPYYSFGDGVLGPDFAASVTTRVTETLQRVHDLRVTAPTSVLRLPASAPIEEVAQRLNVDYLLKGQIFRHDDALGFKQWLFHGATRELILTVELSCALDDLHSFEEGILRRVVADVLVPLRDSEIERVMRKRPRDSTAYELTLRAQVAMNEVESRGMARGRRLLERALELDPRHASAYAWLARYHSLRIGQGWAKDRAAECAAAKRMADAALAIDRDNAVALAIAGHLSAYLLKSYRVAERRLRKAIRVAPNEPLGYLFLAMTLAYTGRAAEGRRLVEYALSLSPIDCCGHVFLSFAATVCYAAGDYEAAEDYARSAIEANSRYSTSYKALVASLVAMGRVAAAREVMGELLAIEPSYPAHAMRTTPFADPAVRELFLRRLRTAGCFDVTVRGPPARKRAAANGSI